MKREDLLEKKMIIKDLDNRELVDFFASYGIMYIYFPMWKIDRISIDCKGEIIYYTKKEKYDKCNYPEIDLRGIFMANKPLDERMWNVGKCTPSISEDTTAKGDFRKEWNALIAECEKNVRGLINEACKKANNEDEEESCDVLISPEVTITVEYLEAEKEARRKKNSNTKEEFYKACRKAENEGRIIDGELYIDGKKYASIALHKIEDIARWIESKKSLKDLNETMKRVEEEVKNNSDILDCVSGAHEMFSRQLEKQQEDLIKAAMGKFAPFDRVLVRRSKNHKWIASLFVRMKGNHYECLHGFTFPFCIPFDPEKLGRVTE